MKICLLDNRILEVDGENLGSVTVAPILDSSLRPSHLIYGVRSALNGTQVAAFTRKSIAVAFAESIDREFGDVLPKAFQNSWDGCEDEQDKWVLDYLDQRADHPARWLKGHQQMKFRKPIGVNR